MATWTRVIAPFCSYRCLAPTRAIWTTAVVSEKAVDNETSLGCPLCRNGLDRFGYKDVLLLRQFLTPDGFLMSRRLTGICPKMQRRMARAIKRSRQMGLLPNFKAPEVLK